MSSSDVSEINIRPAVPEDCEEIMRLIMELAVFEKMPDQVKINADTLRKDSFGEHPKVHFLVAEPVKSESKELLGCAVYFNIYSTWEGISMHLEDLYVTPSKRGQGIGKRLWQAVTKIALDTGCARFQLNVLGWNKVAKDWYERVGCVNLTEKEDWHMMRMSRDGMEKFLNS